MTEQQDIDDLTWEGPLERQYGREGDEGVLTQVGKDTFKKKKRKGPTLPPLIFDIVHLPQCPLKNAPLPGDGDPNEC